MDKNNLVSTIIKKINKIGNLKEYIYYSGDIVIDLINCTYENKKISQLDLMSEDINMDQIREILKENKVYDSQRDSVIVHNSEEDYGLSFIIDNTIINICPFRSTIDGITQKSYNMNTLECMKIKLPTLKKSDYIALYKDINNNKIMSLSVETIIMLKYLTTKKTYEKETYKQIRIDKEKLLRINQAFFKMEKSIIIPQKETKKKNTTIKKNAKTTNKGFINISTISAICVFVIAIIFLIIYVGKN